ncbi:MAG TPA: hypothetical protein VFQ80_13915, partial [Thermomicrobiales bacterium]|nr:hypothetical protein [Thermomicrobiales bacterium]
MDDRRFDALAKSLATPTTRRGALARLLGGASGFAVSARVTRETAAKKRARCKGGDKICNAQGSSEQCCSGLCCPPWVYIGQTKYACAPDDGGSSC